MTCEKCWNDAFILARLIPGKSQTECYQELLDKRKKNPCSPREQAGEYWDENKQQDSRTALEDKT